MRALKLRNLLSLSDATKDESIQQLESIPLLESIHLLESIPIYTDSFRKMNRFTQIRLKSAKEPESRFFWNRIRLSTSTKPRKRVVPRLRELAPRG